MVASFQKKNYYFLQTMKQEVERFSLISFNIFDTLLLREVLFPRDIWKLVADHAEKKYAIHDFLYIRENVEAELASSTPNGTVSQIAIYREIAARYPQWPVEELQAYELEMEAEKIRPNPLMQEIYTAAVTAGKKVCLLADTSLPLERVQQMLAICGYDKDVSIYLSSECSLSKSNGSLYQHILAELQLEPRQWLHIGSDFHGDIEIPRQLHIVAASYRCPRDLYLEDRTEAHKKEEEKAGCTIVQEPLDTSLAFSINTACEINEVYTAVLAPNEDTVISVDHVSMMFNMTSEKVDSMKEYVIRLVKRQLKFQEFWALKDVSFSVRRGERVGLIGLNGSGKSTMLKIVSGVMKPTKGKVGVFGSIAPLIELGAGFDMELSARENVYLNGAILGYSREDMQERYDAIIEFAELRDFENVAIKNFSSGMIARLGFAIATSHIPDILIIDEILSVGDFTFQKKCHKKMQELTQQGATVLFVSHSASDIINMCDRAVWLDHGRLIEEGQAQYIVEKYMNQ